MSSRLTVHALKTTHNTKASVKPTKIITEGLLIKLSHIPDSPPFHIPDSPDAMAIIRADEAASAEPDSSRKTFLKWSIPFSSCVEANYPMIGRQRGAGHHGQGFFTDDQ